MLHFKNRRVFVKTLVGFPTTIGLQVKNRQICAMVLFGLLACGTAYAQNPLPSPSPAPTPITKAGNILVNSPSTVGRISKWVASSSNGTGTIGDSVIVESSIGTIGIGTNPFSDFKLTVDGGSTVAGGVFGLTSVFNGTGVRGRALHPNSGTGVSGFGTTGLYGETVGNNPNGNNIGVWGISASIGGVGVRGQNTAGGLAGRFDGDVTITGLLSMGNLSLNPGGSLIFSDGTIQSTAAKITGVTAGTGLTGGGSVGNVTLGVAASGVNTNQLADNAVTSAKLAPGAVTSAGLSVPLELSGSSVSSILSVTNSGTGVAISATGAIDTSTQYNISGNRVLSTAGTNNVFVGAGAGQNNTANDSSFFGFAAGQANTAGIRNSFFGSNAGRVNITGGDNAFFGAFAGAHNTTGSNNAFFGFAAGQDNTTGQYNNFFGSNAGISNSTGSHNAFFGPLAGRNNTTGSDNAFFGYVAGENSTGGDNAFFGGSAGQANRAGIRNSFFGSSAGLSNTTENNNTFIGAFSNGVPGISNATAIGADAVVIQSNSIVLGNNASVGIGTSAPHARFHVANAGGPAGQFDGNVTITGNLSVSGAASLTATNFSGQITQSQVTNLTADLGSKASQSTVVHLAGAETITGAKSFSGFQLFSGNVGIGMHGPTTATLLNVGGNTGVVAGTFINNANLSGNDALFAMHTGIGNAFRALNTQVIGRAGFFENSHTNSSSPVLETLGRGPGPALKASNIGPGPAAVFTNGNVGIGTAAPQTKFHVANVGGTAGQFDGNVTVNGSLNATNINAGNLVNGVNGLSGAVTLAAGDNVTITPSDNTLTIAAAAGPATIADGSVTIAKIADGAVTAAKLAAGVATLRVVDSLGTEVGVYGENTDGANTTLPSATFYVSSANVWISLPMSKDGFIDQTSTAPLQIYYDTTNCTGNAFTFFSNTQYLQYRVPNSLISPSYTSSNTVYVTLGQPEPMSIHSMKQGTFPCSTAGGTLLLVPVAVVPISDLGLTPPFRLSR